MIVDRSNSTMKDLGLLEKLLNILGITDIKSISQTSTLSELGADSLLVSELRQTMEREYNLIFSAKQIQSKTIQQLKELSEQQEMKNNINIKKSVTSS
jgi:acyl carrier protein